MRIIGGRTRWCRSRERIGHMTRMRNTRRRTRRSASAGGLDELFKIGNMITDFMAEGGNGGLLGSFFNWIFGWRPGGPKGGKGKLDFHSDAAMIVTQNGQVEGGQSSGPPVMQVDNGVIITTSWPKATQVNKFHNYLVIYGCTSCWENYIKELRHQKSFPEPFLNSFIWKYCIKSFKFFIFTLCYPFENLFYNGEWLKVLHCSIQFSSVCLKVSFWCECCSSIGVPNVPKRHIQGIQTRIQCSNWHYSTGFWPSKLAAWKQELCI